MSEIERQRDRIQLAAAGLPGVLSSGGPRPDPEKKGGSSKGSGRKDDVQRKPEDQRSRPDPKDGEGRGAE